MIILFQYIFRQIAQYLATGTYDQPAEAARYEMIRAYYALLAERGVAMVNIGSSPTVRCERLTLLQLRGERLRSSPIKHQHEIRAKEQ